MSQHMQYNIYSYMLIHHNMNSFYIKLTRFHVYVSPGI